MYLTNKTAEKIIQELRDIVDFNINIINNKGVVIASTDSERINTYHEAAQIILSNNVKELIVEFDEQYKGCLSGVNLPLYFSNEIIGIIGITGQPEEVIKHVRIIQKMTEMLIYEYFDLWNRNNYEQIKLTFINDLINGSFLTSLFEVEEKLQRHSLNPKAPFTVALIKYVKESSVEERHLLNTPRYNIVKQFIYEKMESINSLITFNGEFFIILTNSCLDEFQVEIEYLFKQVYGMHHVSLSASIGNTYNSYEDVPKSFNEALSISQYLKNETGVFLFNKLALQVAISKIPENYKATLQNQVFSKCTRKEMEEFQEFIKSYFLCNGSLNQLAKKYYIHKNTVQYKIQKIKEKTDYDLRTFNDMFILYLSSIL